MGRRYLSDGAIDQILFELQTWKPADRQKLSRHVNAVYRKSLNRQIDGKSTSSVFEQINTTFEANGLSLQRWLLPKKDIQHLFQADDFKSNVCKALNDAPLSKISRLKLSREIFSVHAKYVGYLIGQNLDTLNRTRKDYQLLGQTIALSKVYRILADGGSASDIKASFEKPTFHTDDEAVA